MIRWFKLIEDFGFADASVLGRQCNASGTVLDPASDPVELWPDENRPKGMLEGYWGLWHRLDGRWIFLQGGCPDNSCDAGSAAITPGIFEEGHVNEAYAGSISWTDLEEPPVVTGLPPGLEFDSVSGDVTGIPTAAGEYTVTVHGTSVSNECPVTEAFILTINPCRPVDAFIDPDDPPPATIGVAYSHFVLFGDLDGPMEAFGLPPGLTFNGSTGEISGTATTAGTWLVRLRGVTEPNGCELWLVFPLTCGACDPEDSLLYNANGFLGDYQVSKYLPIGYINEPYSAQLSWRDVTLPIYLVAGTLQDGLSFDGSTGEISGTPTECGEEPLTFRVLSEANSCWIYLNVILDIFCGCPDPTDYTELGAWLVSSTSATSSLGISENIPFNEVLFKSSNASWNTVTNLPPGVFWDSSTGEMDGVPDTPGIYATEFYGTVLSGDYGGCQVKHTRTYTVS